MDSEYFTVRGATGVDLSLPIAGPGSRSYAFVIDWHIRLIAALAWLVAAMLVMNGRLTFRPGSGKSTAVLVFLAVLPSAAIYFLYHPVVEVLMRGQTPGKRRAGVRIVNREGGVPSVGAILIRNAFRLVDSMPAFYVVGLLTSFMSAQRTRIGDMAAGTLLVVDESAVSKALLGLATAGRQPNADFLTTDLAEQILERWQRLAVDKRDAIARALLTRIDAAGGATPYASMSDAELEAAITSLARGANSK